jgi:hypothetical protein
MMLTTSLALLHAAGACTDRYRHLAKALGGVKAYGRETPIPLLSILSHNGLHDALWALVAVPEDEVPLRDRVARLFACDCAERVLPVFERECPGDVRPREAIAVARRYAAGAASEAEMAAARDAAGAAAWAAARDAAWAAAWAAARDAAWAAGAAARDAAGAAAWDAARDAGAAARAAAWAAARAAAGDAARAAAWAAARAAAGDAAWAAERAWQAGGFRKLLSAPDSEAAS